MEANSRNIVGVGIERLHTALALIIPNLHKLVVCTRHQVRLITTVVVLDTVDAFFMPTQRIVGRG